ncbi:MAG: hypothetical protein GW905_08970 [Rhodobacterales bacterium]|nr:hypothetical protein [Rhodobacterales bacterium]
MTTIDIGIIGGGYMGKAHAVAHCAVGAIFQTALRPRLVCVAGASPASGARYAAAQGFEKEAGKRLHGRSGPPHAISAARPLIGPIVELSARIETVQHTRGDVTASNDSGALVRIADF